MSLFSFSILSVSVYNPFQNTLFLVVLWYTVCGPKRPYSLSLTHHSFSRVRLYSLFLCVVFVVYKCIQSLSLYGFMAVCIFWWEITELATVSMCVSATRVRLREQSTQLFGQK